MPEERDEIDRQLARAEYQGWGLKGGTIKEYSQYFKKLIQQNNLEILAQEIKSSRGRVVVCDLMGTGSIFPGYSVDENTDPTTDGLHTDGGISLALTDPRSKASQQNQETQNIAYVTGYAEENATWDKVQEFLDKNNYPGLDLVLCRGMGAWKRVPEHLILGVYTKAWNKLNPNGGILLADVPFSAVGKIIKLALKNPQVVTYAIDFDSIRRVLAGKVKIIRSTSEPLLVG